MEKININDILDFAAEKSARKAIFKEGQLDTGLLLYAPGQTTPDHKHSDIDEVFYVISGEGTITINNEEVLVKEKDIIFSPNGETHGFNNTSSDNWVVLQIKIETSKKD
ncbi:MULTISPECIES: cupin domain-containing protein [Clostridia]|uniref:Cupin n=1 Tax=Lacrimispora celerecrescens TaxID=29354 RepID=A0A084JR81_9FIRM|nr:MULTISPECIES: dimethylsulfonioproprionate lyase family protein [Clostridia]KEZ91465.1 cupin [Lacrimispora celerecrescens]MBW4846348.1 cupin domain-containing protein [Lachnospiraceae bacterium]MSS11165.1 cupin domain-containing protein [Clostridium sp. WB02_MRS01]